jgi:hypothetical protein
VQGQDRPAIKENKMLSKQTGPSVVVATTATNLIVNVSNTDGSTVRKIRVAAATAPAIISISTSTNLATAGILIPVDHVEHFNMEGNTHVHIIRSGSTNGIASITPVA